MDFDLMQRVWIFFAQASMTTIKISGLAIVLGLCLGFTAALASLSRLRAVRWPARAYVSVFRGTTALVPAPFHGWTSEARHGFQRRPPCSIHPPH